MKSLQEVLKTHKSETLDGRDTIRLMPFIEEKDLAKFDIHLKPEFVGTHTALPWTRENILSQLKQDVAFGFEKALDKRGLSAGSMAMVVMMWNMILEDGLENFDYEGNYAQYGLPIFKATAIKYGFPNPIGDDEGTESIYEE